MKKDNVFSFQKFLMLGFFSFYITPVLSSVDVNRDLLVSPGNSSIASNSVYRTITVNKGKIILQNCLVDQELKSENLDNNGILFGAINAPHYYAAFRNSIFNGFASFQESIFRNSLAVEGHSDVTLHKKCSLTEVHLFASSILTINNRHLPRYERSHLSYCCLTKENQITFAGDGDVWNPTLLKQAVHFTLLNPSNNSLKWIIESLAGIGHPPAMIPYLNYTTISSIDGKLTGVISLVQSYGYSSSLVTSDFSKLLIRYTISKSKNGYGIPLMSLMLGSTPLIDFKLELLTDFAEDPLTKQLLYQIQTNLKFGQDIRDGRGNIYQLNWVKDPKELTYYLTVTDITP